MLLDARNVDEGAELSCDLCVVGGGAAGITLCRALAGSDLRVLMLESGGLEPDPKTQALYEGENVGQEYSTSATRLRYFGGSTNHWGGISRPFDQIDFEERKEVPHSGWPLNREDLDPHYEQAHRICQLGPYRYDTPFWAERTGNTPPRLGPEVESVVFQFGPPTRFGEVYGEDLRKARNVRVLLHGNLVKLELADNGRTVTRARAATLDGKRFTIRPRQVVLAAGGIENPRILLASNDVQRAGIGNDNDLVGRFFCDHLQGTAGAVLLHTSERAAAFYDVHEERGQPRALGAFITSDRFVRSKGSLRYEAALLTTDASKEGLGQAIAAVTTDVEGRGARRSRMLIMSGEPAPNPDSRVTLTDEADRLGVPKVRLNWQLTELDRESGTRSLEAIARALGAAGIGRIQSRAVVDKGFWGTIKGGSHHQGTTRMHTSPRRGVVDENCRVHGVSNLYVAGSSVFPTPGLSNPTLTIVALTLRLAAHLKGSFR